MDLNTPTKLIWLITYDIRVLRLGALKTDISWRLGCGMHLIKNL